MKTLLLILLGITIFNISAEDINLLKNAGFSQTEGKNLTGFQCVVAPGGLNILQDEDGTKILQLTKVAPDKPCMVIQRNLPLEQNKTYLFSCEVRSTDLGKCMIYAEWRSPLADGKFKHVSVNAKTITPSPKWEEIVFEIGTRPVDCEAPYIVLAVSENSVEFRNLKLMGAE